mgnify:CR=1 FL=1
MRAGLFLYDHLGAHKLLPPTKTIDLTHHPAGAPLKRDFRKGFVYSDGWVDDARLVVLNAMDAAEHGALVRTYTEVVRFVREDGRVLGVEARDVAHAFAAATTASISR